MTVISSTSSSASNSSASRGRWNSRPVRRLRRNPIAIIGAGLVIAFLILAIFAPVFATPNTNCLRDLGYSEKRTPTILEPVIWRAVINAPASCYTISRYSFSREPTPPDARAQLGTVQGYDIRYGLIWGARTMLTLGIVIVGATVILGAMIGLISGFYGGIIDNALMRLTDVIFAFPSLVLNIVLVAIFGPSLWNIALSFVIVGWPSYARVVRGEVLRVRNLEYVEAARALGASQGRTMFRHVLPNTLGSLTVLAVLDMGTIPLFAGALSFLGLGTPVGYADWGQLVQFAQAWIQGPPGQPFAYWYVSFFPGLTILLFSLGWNLLGDALQAAFDPRAT
jgi:peptide/nickel transport system permease protein